MRPPQIIAEISANHLGRIERAIDLIARAKTAGADAVKFQLYDPDKMAPKGMVLTTGAWKGRNAVELYREAMTPREWFAPLFAYAAQLGIQAFSSVFDVGGLEFLEKLGCPRYKISSFEIQDWDLIMAVAETGKPLIMSTGMADWNDIDQAVGRVRSVFSGEFTLLKCVSGYPAPLSEMNLLTMDAMFRHWPVSVGLSDHSMGSTAAVVATSLGASMIEKHLTLTRIEGGPDAAFSAEPHEFAAMAAACREAAQALGTVRYGPTPSEAPQLPLKGRTMKARNA